MSNKPSALGVLILNLIDQGIDTEGALSRALDRDPAQIARALAALKIRELIHREWHNGCMRYRVNKEDPS